MVDLAWLIPAVVCGIMCGSLVGIWLSLLKLIEVFKQSVPTTYSLMKLQNELLVKLFSEENKKK